MAKITTVVDGFDVERCYIYASANDEHPSNAEYFTNHDYVNIIHEDKGMFFIQGNGYRTNKDDLGNTEQENIRLEGYVKSPFVIR